MADPSGVSDGIINLGDYIRRRDGADEPASTFSLWGADGERSRFALPLWRAIYLAQGERGGILWRSEAEEKVRPFVVLDLASEPARTEFAWPADPDLDPERVPCLTRLPGLGLVIYLGEEKSRQWFLVVADGKVETEDLTGHDREDVLFLAGECAGLLFLRDFADEVDSQG